MKVGIIGASGFTGVELIRILKNHPKVDLELLTSESFVGKKISELYPSVGLDLDMELEVFDSHDALRRCDILFLALPHGYSSELVAMAYADKKIIIDLGADFRLKKIEEYSSWYETDHKAPHLLDKAVYGLPEIHREEIKGAKIIANPGCYPTSAILALAPLLKKSLIDIKGLVIDSKSGVSGAGRRATPVTHFNSANENINPYRVIKHRHTPEIEQELSLLAGEEVSITFTPHLIPINRGMLSTCYASLLEDLEEEELRKIYEDFYKDEAFVKILPKGIWPHTKWVLGSNNCLLNFEVDKRNKRIVIASVIDNLTKGASGQAVQNMNIVLGIEETTGLASPAIYP